MTLKQEIRSIAFRPNNGPTGGPGGSNALLEIYNSKLQIIPNLTCYYRKTFFKNHNLHNWLLHTKKGEAYINKLDEISYMHKCIKDSNKETLFIAHDVWSAYKLATNKINYILSYHQQGSLVEELPSLGQFISNKRTRQLIKMEKKAFLDASKIIFTSKGSLESFIKTTRQTGENIEIIKSKSNIVYNTCMLYEEAVRPVEVEEINIKQGKNKKKKIILTVSSLSTFKGVDQIPKFLSEIKNFKENFIWVLCGEGHLEKKIHERIHNYKLHNNFVHIKRRMPQTELQFLYRNCSYYLMMHRISIFDMATLEAMSNGCIPLLTHVGGNIEMNRNNNIIYIDKKDITSLNNNNQYLNKLGATNRDVFYKYFGPEALLNGYMQVIESK